MEATPNGKKSVYHKSLKGIKKEGTSNQKFEPFNLYGSGISQYFSFLRVMMFTYLAICVIMIPIFYILNSGPDKHTALSLGNLGFVRPLCYV